ncbi:MAG: GntR family transcriptional regulator [Lachnospiraceae bacterium]|nr:GntR family transcriptional regulator [Lachnospiraceae bacterium]
MKVDFDNNIPIYIQIADAIEDDILSGKLEPGGNCYSQVVLAKELKVNPATAAKGIKLLVERDILEKVRGQAMIIKNDAIATIKARRIDETLKQLISQVVTEAMTLGVEEKTLIEKIKEEYHGK